MATGKQGGREAASRKAGKRSGEKASRLPRPAAADPPAKQKDVPRAPVVVALGASAGGLDAFKKFLSAMPSQSGMAFVLIQHLDPTHKSLMAYLLGKYTSMTAVEVEDRMPIEANRVYLIPPDRYMSIQDGALRLAQRRGRREMRMPIDHFFRSLAEKQQEESIGIILSGTGADGTLGLKAIKAHGGMVMAQEPETALHDDMPRSAIATGMVDHVLAVEEMPAALIRHVRSSHLDAAAKPRPAFESTASNLDAIIMFLRSRTRHDFRMYKKATVLRCIERHATLHHLDQGSDYLNFLMENPSEVRQLLRRLLIGGTGFFREPKAFRFLEEEVVPRLIEEKDAAGSLRVWVPGCATGEEPYSIAMILLEGLARARKSCDLQVFSTDVDEEALAFARHGAYPETIGASVSPERLRRFFSREGQSLRISKPVRESVIFAMQNLISDPAFSRLDLICCRNLLTYLEPAVQRQILARFSSALNDRGHLFLGRSESTGRHDDLFHPLSRKWRIYRRAEPRSPAAPGSRIQPDAPARSGSLRPEMRPPSPSALAALVQPILLEHYRPVWVLVNDERQVVHFNGATGLYLEMPSGRPTLDVLSLARKGLRTKLRAALQQASRDRAPVTIDSAFLKGNGGGSGVKVTVTPVNGPRSVASYLLIIFENDPRSPPIAVPGGAADLVRLLGRQLQSTREELERTIEQMEPSNQELKASNEEVESMNEELQSANEELEASKEELQSLNEELSTVNSELHEKVDELTAINNDLANLFSSTDIATVFLDMRLCITRFSPATKRLLNLIPSDLGRPISDISHKILDADLLAGAGAVLRDLTPVEEEVQTGDGEWYTMRILPYRTSDNRVDGVIVTFNDVTRIKTASEELIQRARQQAAVTHLGDRALAQELEPQALMDHAVRIVAEALHTEQSCVFQLLPEMEALRLRAGVGWRTGLVGTSTVPTDAGSYTGFALRSNAPVIVEDLSGETRFGSPALFLDHGVLSGASVVIQGGSGPFGLLGAYCAQRRRFAEFEVKFLQSVANVLAHAIKRTGYEDELRTLNQTLEERVVERTAFVKVLQDVAVIANEAASVDNAFLVALERICRHMDWPVGHAYMSKNEDCKEFVDQGLWFHALPNRFGELMELTRRAEFKLGFGMAGRVAASGKPEWIRNVDEHESFMHTDKAQSLGVKAAFAFPVLIRRRVVAVLEFFAPEVAEPDEPLLEVMAHVGAQLGRVVERQRLQQELLDAVWQQQREFGQELHDNLGQQLAGVAMMAKSLEQKLTARSLPDAEPAKELLKGLQGAQRQVRSIAKGLFPVQVEAHGLMSGLEDLALTTRARHGVSCTFEYDRPVPVKDNKTATHLFHIVQEAITNAVMHGRAKQIVVALKASSGFIELTVRDDGVGIHREADHREGTGLRIMEYRAGLIGANLEIAPGDGRGTVITCSLRQDDRDPHEEPLM